MNLFYGCQEATFLLTDFLEEALPWHERLLLRSHLNRCDECRKLLADFRALPGLVKNVHPEADLLPLAERALASALDQLGRAPRAKPPTSVPEIVLRLLAAGPDLPLRILAETHQAMFSAGLPKESPYLPQRVLSQLPSPDRWNWRRSGQVQRALLAVDAKGGQRLSIMNVPPNHQIPAHSHRGTESVLVLEGEMEDAGRCLRNGDWIHFEEGSSHAPYVFKEGCWCLVRDEGTVKYRGAFGWLRGVQLSPSIS